LPRSHPCRHSPLAGSSRCARREGAHSAHPTRGTYVSAFAGHGAGAPARAVHHCPGQRLHVFLTTLRLGAAGESATTIGIVSSTYFIGLTLGAIFNDRLILRIGHIRAYTSFASLIAVTILLQGLFYDVTWWSVLRLINGWAAVGVFLVIESWLLLAGDAKIRGRLLALYMIAFYGAGVIAQAGLGEITQLGDTAPFMLAGVLAALSVLPIVILPRVSPLLDQVEPSSPASCWAWHRRAWSAASARAWPLPASMPCCRCTCSASAWRWVRSAT
jgi:MFS family permease